MTREKLKDCLDDALSGLQENPHLYRQVLARAEGEAPVQIRRKASFGMILVVLLAVVTMSAGIAAARGWNVLDFLFGFTEAQPEIDTAPIHQEAVSEGASLTVDSAVYDGRVLAFDWSIENRKPEIPMYCNVEEFTANGVRVWTDGTDSFDQQWLPGFLPESSWQDGEYVLLPKEIQGAERLHVDMKVALYRPTRPIYQMESFDPKEAEQKTGEGFFVIAGGEGFVGYDPEEKQWIQWFGGDPAKAIGEYQLEQLTLSFDIRKPEHGYWTLTPMESYENEHCTAVYETAEITPLGLYLTLNLFPKDAFYLQMTSCELTDETGAPLTNESGESYFPSMGEGYGRENNAVRICQYCWNGIRAQDLPDTISLSCLLDSGEKMIFPVTVRPTPSAEK